MICDVIQMRERNKCEVKSSSVTSFVISKRYTVTKERDTESHFVFLSVTSLNMPLDVEYGDVIFSSPQYSKDKLEKNKYRCSQNYYWSNKTC